jgi:hypothetical protein
MIETPEFFQQLSHWSIQARVRLEEKNLSAVSELMFLIRGTSLQFGFFQLALLARLAEDVARYALSEGKARTTRKCIDGIWDALTTLEYMLANGVDQTTDEQKLLIHRLESTLKSFKDFKPALTQSQIDVIVRAYAAQRKA